MPISPMTEPDVEKGLSQDEEEVEEKPSAGTGTASCTDTRGEAIEEGRKAVVKRGVEGPTKKEREEHEATHCPYRSWCRH